MVKEGNGKRPVLGWKQQSHPDGSENAVWAWCQGLVFHSSDRLTDELWEAGERLSLRVPLLWRHSWAEQDLLQTTTRETESIWFNRCPSRQAPEELAANPAMLEASSAAQPISDITGMRRRALGKLPVKSSGRSRLRSRN
nr:uncharacterized protein LOC105883105 isoform X2 [Microcebus murinus]XP_020140364.1 uncharacterized protein LOC105883105 isoform X2 [Microcebus murinus]